jgi:predicted nucleotidyltransferase
MQLTINGKKLKLHFLTIVGSTLQGLNGDKSDIDIKGVFTWEHNVLMGLNEVPEQLDKNSMLKNDRIELMKQLKEKFPNNEFDEDLDLFEAKKFFLNAIKNDSNMLDMLWADTVDDGKMVLFCSPEFENVLRNRNLFLNLEILKKRFMGMSFSTFKLGKKQNNENKFKDLAKSIQSLFSFKNVLQFNDFSPRLNNEQTNIVKTIKFNLKNISHKDLIQEVDQLRQGLEERLNQLFVPVLNDEQKQKNFDRLNQLLLLLRN